MTADRTKPEIDAPQGPAPADLVVRDLIEGMTDEQYTRKPGGAMASSSGSLSYGSAWAASAGAESRGGQAMVTRTRAINAATAAAIRSRIAHSFADDAGRSESARNRSSNVNPRAADGLPPAQEEEPRRRTEDTERGCWPHSHPSVCSVPSVVPCREPRSPAEQEEENEPRITRITRITRIARIARIARIRKRLAPVGTLSVPSF